MGRRILVQVLDGAEFSRDRRMITNFFYRLQDNMLGEQRLLDNIDQVHTWFMSAKTGRALQFLSGGCLRAVLSNRSSVRRTRMHRVSDIIVTRIAHWLCTDTPEYNGEISFNARLAIADHARNWALRFCRNSADDHRVLAEKLLPILKTSIDFLERKVNEDLLETVPICSALPRDVRLRQQMLFE